MARKRDLNAFNISFLDLLSGALGAVIILFVAVPKAKKVSELPKPPSKEKELLSRNILLQSQINRLEVEVEELKIKNAISEVTPPIQAPTEPAQGILDVDVGFKFKGKKIVFLIDVSGSMSTLDKIGQVKAGLKMLITSMPKDYEIDVIQFPGKNNTKYYALWSYTQTLGEAQKVEVYRFLDRLRPKGATPTRSALNYALTRYSGLTDIVLLSDGAPTKAGTSSYDDIQSILNEVKKANFTNIQINTIGVGPAFTMDSQSPALTFLKELAKNSSGFFYGF